MGLLDCSAKIHLERVASNNWLNVFVFCVINCIGVPCYFGLSTLHFFRSPVRWALYEMEL